MGNCNCFRMKTGRRHMDLFSEEVRNVSFSSTRAVRRGDFGFTSLRIDIANDHTEDSTNASNHSTNVSISSTPTAYGDRNLNSAFSNCDVDLDESNADTMHNRYNISGSRSASSLEENRDDSYSPAHNTDNDSFVSENTDIPDDFVENVQSVPLESLDENSDSDDIATPDISLELESLASEPERIYIDGETCGICANNFNEDEHRPWILPCGHTMCYYCVRKLAKKYNFIMFECPLDRKPHLCKLIYRNTDDGNISGEDYDLSSDMDFPNMECETVDENNDEDPVLPQFVVNNTNTRASRTDHLTNTEPDAAVNQREQEARTIFTKDSNRIIENELQTKDISVESHQEVLQNNNNIMDIESGSQGRSRQKHVTVISISEIPQRPINPVYQNLRNNFPSTNGESCRGRYSENGIQWDSEDAVTSVIPDSSHKYHYDIYADERSGKSYEWVEPDYPDSDNEIS